MKKVVQLSESELNNVIKKVISEDTEDSYGIFIDHWKGKFERSVQILLKYGFKSDDLIQHIKIIEGHK